MSSSVRVRCCKFTAVHGMLAAAMNTPGNVTETFTRNSEWLRIAWLTSTARSIHGHATWTTRLQDRGAPACRACAACVGLRIADEAASRIRRHGACQRRGDLYPLYRNRPREGYWPPVTWGWNATEILVDRTRMHAGAGTRGDSPIRRFGGPMDLTSCSPRHRAPCRRSGPSGAMLYFARLLPGGSRYGLHGATSPASTAYST